MLTQGEGEFLLKAARSAIESHLKGKAFSPPDTKSPALLEKRGAFVTLTEEGSLRGCIGRIEAKEPLIQTVSQMALEAAFRDPRFPSLHEKELPAISVEVSVLSPLRRVERVEEIQVGRDGLLIEKGFAAGLLLPQVATEYGWTREEFLEHTCLKAALPVTAWKEKGVNLYAFTAEIFSEKKR
ncbi:MAG: AmmeMemoRadiSam system protein A [Candidatus Omnitrophota bacterium]